MMIMIVCSSVPVFAEGDGTQDTEQSNNVEGEFSYTAIEERRKGEKLVAATEARQEEFEAKVAEYFDDNDIIMLAQLIDIEANSVYPLNRRAAVAWTVLNRLDNGRWGPTTIAGIIQQPGQYAWYSSRNYSQLNYDIAKDVLTRWATEKIEGQPNFGRVLPPNFESFYGDGSQNHFYDANGSYWDYSVINDPYENW